MSVVHVQRASPTRGAFVVRPGEAVAPALLGGKAGSLWTLASQDFPVPRFAVITTDAYRAVEASPEIRGLLDELGPVEGDDEGQRLAVDDAFATVPLPPELEGEIATAAIEVAGPHGSLAVRSSATAEDLGGASFAGQYSSFLDIRGPAATLAAVRRTWASLWHPAARRYRQEQGMGEGPAMAVILMELVRPELAGVAFTVDPAGDEDHVRVEMVAGFADRLVAGEVTPEAHLVPREEPGAADSQMAARVAALALRAEHLFGAPQDVEWVWDGSHVLLVQSRPITVAGSADDDGFDLVHPERRYTTAGIAEMLPGVLAPLVWHTAGTAVDEALLGLFSRLGALGAEGRDGALGRVRGRAVIDLDLLRSVADRLPGVSAAGFEQQLLGSDVRLAGPAGEERAPIWRRWAHDVRVARVRSVALAEGEVVLRAVPSIVESRPDLDDVADSELLAYRSRLVQLLGRATRAEVAVAACAAASFARLVAFLASYTDLDAATALASGVTRGRETPTAMRRWVDLAHQVHETTSGREALGHETWEAARACLRCDDGGDRVCGHIDEVVRTAGSRAVVSGESWEENPDAAWRAVRSAASRQGGRTLDEPLRVRDVVERLADTPRWRRLDLVTGVLVDTQAVLVRRHAEDSGRLLEQREALKANLLMLGGEIRRVHLEIGRRLVERGRLTDGRDVDLLASSELAPSLAGGGPPPVAVMRRRRRLDQAARVPLPQEFVGRPPPPAEAPVGGDRFEGWGAAGGSYEGRARVVASSEEHVEPGDVLVARTTDPSWGPLFMVAGALVVEQGGPLSHAAVVARELGLPAVVNVPGIVDRIGTATPTVRVDGTHGTVTVVGEGEVAS